MAEKSAQNCWRRLKPARRIAGEADLRAGDQLWASGQDSWLAEHFSSLENGGGEEERLWRCRGWAEVAASIVEFFSEAANRQLIRS